MAVHSCGSVFCEAHALVRAWLLCGEAELRAQGLVLSLTELLGC